MAQAIFSPVGEEVNSEGKLNLATCSMVKDWAERNLGIRKKIKSMVSFFMA
jgi:hypothetical protein